MPTELHAIPLKKDELLLIEKLRSSPKYSTLTVEKRPTAEYPDGEIARIVIEQSFLVREMRVQTTFDTV